MLTLVEPCDKVVTRPKDGVKPSLHTETDKQQA